MIAKEIQYDYDLESYDEGEYLGLNTDEISKMLIEFAKHHVKEALKEADKHYQLTYDIEGFKHDDNLLNAYPEDKIK